MTEKLYNTDSHMHTFTAQVLFLRHGRGALWPGTGSYRLLPGGWRPVRGHGCAHLSGRRPGTGAGRAGEERADRPCDGSGGGVRHGRTGRTGLGTAVFQYAAAHGEHIVSGLVHAAYGYDNVGFHLGREIVTMDFNGTIPAEDVPELERRPMGQCLPICRCR